VKRTLLPALALVGAAALTGCASDGSPSASSSSSPSATAAALALDYNSRFGSNRFAAEAAVAVGRQLYSQGGQFWEINVRTDPTTLPGTYDPTVLGPRTHPVNGATAITVFMATESANAIKAYRAGGVDHEKAEVTRMAALLSTLFPTATTVTVQVYFGEANHYATATYSGGALTYKLLAIG
jgi:hypothetical protein